MRAPLFQRRDLGVQVRVQLKRAVRRLFAQDQHLAVLAHQRRARLAERAQIVSLLAVARFVKVLYAVDILVLFPAHKAQLIAHDLAALPALVGHLVEIALHLLHPLGGKRCSVPLLRHRLCHFCSPFTLRSGVSASILHTFSPHGQPALRSLPPRRCPARPAPHTR